MLVAAAAFFLAAAPATAQTPPWQAADQMTNSLFDAQIDLILRDPSAGSIDQARAALSGRLRAGLARSATDELREIERQLGRAARAIAAGDGVALASARGTITSALRRGAFGRTVQLTAADRPVAARQWLQIRDFRQSTRFTRVGTGATDALIALVEGEVQPEEAVLQVRKDLLDTYQSRLATNKAEADQAADRGFPERLAETAATVNGYWQILRPVYREQRGVAETVRSNRDFARLAYTAARSDLPGFRLASLVTADDLDGFVASPFTEEELARRAAQLTRFLDLIPIEYRDGTEDGRVTIPFELQEASAFHEGVTQAFTDLEAALLEIDPAAVERLDADIERLGQIVGDANERTKVVPEAEVEQLHEEISSGLDRIFPEQWKASDDEADFDLVQISLDQLVSAASAGGRGNCSGSLLFSISCGRVSTRRTASSTPSHRSAARCPSARSGGRRSAPCESVARIWTQPSSSRRSAQ